MAEIRALNASSVPFRRQKTRAFEFPRALGGSTKKAAPPRGRLDEKPEGIAGSGGKAAAHGSGGPVPVTAVGKGQDGSVAGARPARTVNSTRASHRPARRSTTESTEEAYSRAKAACSSNETGGGPA